MSSADDIVARCLDLFGQQQYTQAGELALEALDCFPTHAFLWQLRGNACWFLGEYEVARVALEVAQDLGPLQPLACFALASCYAHADDREEARDLFRDLLLDDRCPTALLPKVAVGLGRLEEHWLALQVCRKLARRAPAHHGAYFGMAFYMARLGYPAESFFPRLLRAHQLAPDLLHYRLNLAFVLAHLGQMDQAHELLIPVAPESVPCACLLRRMIAIFDWADDGTRTAAFQQRLAGLEAE